MIDAYVEHASALLSLPNEADALRRRQQMTDDRSARDGLAEIQAQREALANLVDLLDSLARGLPRIETSSSTMEDADGPDLVELLRHLVAELQQVQNEVMHTKRALRAEQKRVRDEQQAQETRARERRQEEADELARRSRRSRVRLLCALAVGIAAFAGCAVGALVDGSLILGIAAVVVAIASLAVATRMRRVHVDR